MSDQLKQVLAKVQAMTPAQLKQMGKLFEREEKIQSEQKKGRGQVRVDRLAEHYEQLLSRIKAEPDHPKIEMWKVKLKGYEVSLQNWKKFGQETPPGPKAGVKIEVPLGRLGLKTGG